jgi:hypothetical protein
MKKLDVPQSGSQGQTTASRNRFGQYDRQRAMPTQPRSAAQLAVRAAFAAASAEWKALTDAARLAWKSYAESVSLVDSLGQVYFLTGHQMFVSVNRSSDAAGIGLILTAPPVGSPAPAGVVSVSASTIVGAAITIGAAGTEGSAIIMCSPPQSPGVTYCRDFRQICTGEIVADDDAVTVIAARIAAKFGALAVGQTFFVKVVQVSVDGVAGAEQVVKLAINA